MKSQRQQIINNFINHVYNSYEEYDREYARLTDAGVDIIMPVFKGVQETKNSIDSILDRTDSKFSLLLINDNSPESQMKEMLSAYSSDERVIIIERDYNIGFAGTVNEGLQCTKRDVVIINSDVEVCTDWLDNIIRAAAWNLNAATITPFSTNSGIFTLFDTEETDRHGYQHLAGAVSKLFDGRYYSVPTGNGFCMYIRRSAIEKVGLFDDIKYRDGYGEENDFCMRCQAAGYINVLCPSVMIRHTGSVSFGSENKKLLADAHRKLLTKTYPSYDEQLKVWKEDTEYKNYVSQLKERCINLLALSKDSVLAGDNLLIAMHRGEGGSIYNRIDLSVALQGVLSSYLLTGDLDSLYLEFLCNGSRVLITKYPLENQLRFNQFRREDLADLYAAILRLYRIKYVNMSHLLGETFDLPVEACRAGIPCIYVVHDYYCLCPAFSLLDSNNKFCEGNCSQVSNCTVSRKWIRHPAKKPYEMVEKWRRNFSLYFGLFDYICAPSSYTAELLKEYYKESADRIVTIEHGRDFSDDWCLTPAYPEPGCPVRVVLLGNIGKAKGYDSIVEFSKINLEGKVELHIFGDIDDSIPLNGVVLHGSYNRDELPELIRKIRPSYGFVSSIAQETYCHTLTELWKMGLPVVVYDIGPLKSRMITTGAGWIIPSGDAQRLYSLLTSEISEDEYQEKLSAVKNIRFSSRKEMAGNYISLFKAAETNKIDINYAENLENLINESPEKYDMSTFARDIVRIPKSENRFKRFSGLFKVFHWMRRGRV